MAEAEGGGLPHPQPPQRAQGKQYPQRTEARFSEGGQGPLRRGGTAQEGCGMKDFADD